MQLLEGQIEEHEIEKHIVVQNELVTYLLDDVVKNPFRDLRNYSYEEERLEQLMELITHNGFIPNVIGRVRDGKLQLAFGHHRVEALRRLGIKQAEFLVQDLNDAKMLRYLLMDNDTEFKHGLEVLFEAISGAVNGFADGTFKPYHIAGTTPYKYLRYAPSFLAGVGGKGVPYTTLSVAKQLGKVESNGRGGVRPTDEIKTVLFALECLENNIVSRGDIFTGHRNEPELNMSGVGWLAKPVHHACAFPDAESLAMYLKTKLARERNAVMTAQKATRDATATLQESQRQIDELKKQENLERAARKVDLAQLAALSEDTIDKEVREYREAKREREEKEKAAAPELRRKRRALNKKVKEEKEKYEAARKAEAKAAAAVHLAAIKKPAIKQPYLPHLTELIKHFEEPLPACAAKVLADSGLLTTQQKKNLEQSFGKAIKNIREYWKQLLSS